MRTELPGHCAACRAETVRLRALSPPLEWAEYLLDRRGLSPVGALAIPLCPGCAPRFEELAAAMDDPAVFDDGELRDLWEGIFDALDDLDDEFLVDDRRELHRAAD